MQGSTIQKGSKLIVHWQKGFKAGMAYVMLGRCESLDDMYIAGDFDPSLIKCDKAALKESQRIDSIVKARNEEEKARKIAEDVIDFLEIEEYRYSYILSLPYGIQKRIELGRALAMQPKVILLPLQMQVKDLFYQTLELILNS